MTIRPITNSVYSPQIQAIKSNAKQAWLSGAKVGEITNNGSGSAPFGFAANPNFNYLAVVDIGYNFIEYEFIFDRSDATSGTGYATVLEAIPCSNNILLTQKGTFKFSNLVLGGGSTMRAGEYQVRTAEYGFKGSYSTLQLESSTNYKEVYVNLQDFSVSHPDMALLLIMPVSLSVPFGGLITGRLRIEDFYTNIKNV